MSLKLFGADRVAVATLGNDPKNNGIHPQGGRLMARAAEPNGDMTKAKNNRCRWPGVGVDCQEVVDHRLMAS